MSHLPRLTVELAVLLHTQRVAALGTLDAQGLPFVSMVPYAIAIEPGLLVLHVSGLAAHTGNMERSPAVSALVMRSEVAGEPVHALQRVTLSARAETLAPEHPLYAACRAAYLQRFPEAEPMTELPDFRFVALHLQQARQVAGFGAARSVDFDTLQEALRTLP
ncbi:pyridoxamine 5'-phosphate oxidase family protein [Curvibacter sp. APW13]|uniref:pyridoxamine 5'-phosphate oxidase family protein n=1 Tax=Curvibacter sp. APW13 TaxID=3077236 RepID=UPI0028DE6B0E|nr:pyridoxamine 5'-phosphate oxidase family protein [Curvibacter sp. APW13]MDT8990357.1 pyridoxamine 5'-phosphate oxidase family protein [Curvibacter sp. APW13]